MIGIGLGVVPHAIAKDPAPAAKAAATRSYATPEEAATALYAAAKSGDSEAVIAVLGPGSKPLISSGDPVADEAARERFVASYDEGHALAPSGDSEVVLETGTQRWPFPIPLVRGDAGWHFDTMKGQQEILDRRIGANELSAIQSCLAYVDAQREYADWNPLGETLPPYAQKLASSPGKKDGLYWDAAPGDPESPLGPEFARARAQGYSPAQGRAAPYHGYMYRVLTAQGPNAPGGAYDYVVRGKMIGGFALVAYPARWNVSGVYTFLVNQDGVVYQKDLGPDTAKIALAMKSFDPDGTWTKLDAGTDGASPPAPAPAAAPAPAGAPEAAAPPP